MNAQTIELKARMNHPVAIFPDAMQALQALGKVAHNRAVPLRTLMLVELRASQINGCAALALTEALTRISDRPDPVPDDIWDEAARHYDEAALATLLVAIANINVCNRLNVGVRQVVGAWNG
jgi:alkylhydroperoxidase family enzyme